MFRVWLVAALLDSALTDKLAAKRVWTICEGTVPSMPTAEAMGADVEVGMASHCSQEYTFEEMCDVDLDALLAYELDQDGSMFMNAMNRRVDSPDGSMAVSTQCAAGSTCYMICTSGASVMELAEQSSDPPSAGTETSTHDPTPEEVQSSCAGQYFTKEQVLEGALFRFRQEFLIEQGVDPTSKTLICPYAGSNPRYTAPNSASLIASKTDVHLRGGKGLAEGSHEKSTRKACTSLASLAEMSPAEVLKLHPVLRFLKAEPNAKTMSHGDHVFKKFVIHHVYWDESVRKLSMKSYAGQTLVIDPTTGKAMLTQRKPREREEVLDGARICLDDTTTEGSSWSASKGASLTQQHAFRADRHSCKGGDCHGRNFGGALLTSGSFTMMASGGAG